MNVWSWAWVAWTGAFAVTEGLALRNKRQNDTLSENTRMLFHTKTSKAGRVAFGLGWLGFAGWFFWHILWQR